MMMIFSLWLAFNAVASKSATDAQLRFLFESQSLRDLQHAAVVGSSLESRSQECELDLKLKRVPAGCFAEAKVRMQSNLITGEEYERKVRALTSLCRQAARTNSEFHSLKVALSSESLSQNCRKAVKMRIDDLEYQIGEVRELDRFLK